MDESRYGLQNSGSKDAFFLPFLLLVCHRSKRAGLRRVHPIGAAFGTKAAALTSGERTSDVPTDDIKWTRLDLFLHPSYIFDDDTQEKEQDHGKQITDQKHCSKSPIQH